VGDAHRLVVSDAAFDVVHAQQVLQHLGDPIQALGDEKGMRTRGRRGRARQRLSRVRLVPQRPAFDEWMPHRQATAIAEGGEPQAGRRLPSWARAAGFTEIAATSSTWCFASPAD
jgi:hypothetical protein